MRICNYVLMKNPESWSLLIFIVYYLSTTDYLLVYLQHLPYSMITDEGLQPTQAKVIAMQNAPVPQNITQLKYFLGLINYYRKFLPDHLSLLAPLNNLLQHTSNALVIRVSYDRACDNRPCECKLDQVVFLLISSIQKKIVAKLQKKAH